MFKSFCNCIQSKKKLQVLKTKLESSISLFSFYNTSCDTSLKVTMQARHCISSYVSYSKKVEFLWLVNPVTFCHCLSHVTVCPVWLYKYI